MMESFQGIPLVSLAALAIFLMINSNNNVVVSALNPDLPVNIRDACKITTNPDFCFSSLSSDVRSRGKTFRQLTYLSIVKSNEKGKEGRNIVSGVQKITTDPLVKRILNICLDSYDVGPVEGTAVALEEFKNSQYSLVPFDISKCIETLEDCDDAFQTPGVSGNVIGSTNELVTKYCSVALDLANSLAGK